MLSCWTQHHCKEYIINFDPSLGQGDFKTLQTKKKGTCKIQDNLNAKGGSSSSPLPLQSM
jgi:hypothetical protein